MSLKVCAFLWNDPSYRWNKFYRYTEEHVRRFFSAVDRNLSIPHENVLITDHPGDFGVRVVPMWDDHRNLPGWRGEGNGNYARLKMFDRGTALLIGERFAFFDLDCVIVDSLDPILSRDDEFLIMAGTAHRTPYCASFVMMDAGCRQSLWDRFNAAPDEMIKAAEKYVGTDQAIMSLLGREKTVGEGDGIYKFRDLKPLPSNARIVFFNGPVDPSMPSIRKNNRWIEEHWH